MYEIFHSLKKKFMTFYANSKTKLVFKDLNSPVGFNSAVS